MKYKNLLMLSILSIAILLSACGSSSSDISEENTEIVATADAETESTETTDTETESIETTDTETESVATADTETEKTEVEPDETITFDIEDLDKTMYAQKSCNIRKGPSTDYDKAGSLDKNESVHVIGKTTYNGSTWYLIESSDSTDEFVASSLLGDSKVETTTKKDNTNSDSNKSSDTSKNDTSNNDTSSSDSNTSSDNSSSSSGTHTFIDSEGDVIESNDVSDWGWDDVDTSGLDWSY
jgi:epidermal growth factor receptor substrate 15